MRRDPDLCARCGDVFPDNQACNNCTTLAEHMRAVVTIIAHTEWWQTRLPLWLANWIWTWCVRCDQVVTRWHYRGCPCIVITDGPIVDAINRALRELGGGR